jgi:heavy metal sensor kinase
MIKTFRFRLTIIYTVAFVFTFIIFTHIIFIEYRNGRLESADKDLLITAKAKLLDEYNPKPGKNEEIIKRVGDEYYQIINQNGRVITTHLSKNQQWPLNLNRDLMLMAFKGTSQYETVKYEGENYRTLYFSINEDSILCIRKSLESIYGEINRLERRFLFFLPFILTISSLMSWFYAGKILAPFISMKSLAEKIKHGRLGERISIGLKGKEIDDLVIIFNDMLESIQRSIEAQKRFTSDVSHEIKSPLTSLRGSIEVTLRRERTPEEYEDILRKNLADIFRLSRITDNLLFLARADNNIIGLRKQRIDIKHLLETVVKDLRYKTFSAGLSIIEDYQDNVELNGDIDLLQQAFSNLIDNAIKYTSRGGRITIKTQEGDTNITVTISDTGIGIPENDISHIFERFYRVSKERSRKSGGTGLGLSITHWIVNAHNGEIIVKSKVGAGSDFIIVFPKTQD